MRISDWSSDVCSSDLEEVEAQLGDSAQLQYRLERLSEEGAKQVRYRLEITNANDRPAPAEIRLQQSDGFPYATTSARLGMKTGDRLWKVTVPAKGSVKRDYVLERSSEERRVGKEFGSQCRSRWSPQYST